MFPEDFLRSHGAEMIATGEQTIRSAGAQRGFGALLVLMVRLLFDMAARLPAEHGSELMSDVRYGLRFMLGSKGMVAAVSLSTGRRAMSRASASRKPWLPFRRRSRIPTSSPTPAQIARFDRPPLTWRRWQYPSSGTDKSSVSGATLSRRIILRF
jgi:hypothetical protein